MVFDIGHDKIPLNSEAELFKTKSFLESIYDTPKRSNEYFGFIEDLINRQDESTQLISSTTVIDDEATNPTTGNFVRSELEQRAALLARNYIRGPWSPQESSRFDILTERLIYKHPRVTDEHFKALIKLKSELQVIWDGVKDIGKL